MARITNKLKLVSGDYLLLTTGDKLLLYLHSFEDLVAGVANYVITPQSINIWYGQVYTFLIETASYTVTMKDFMITKALCICAAVTSYVVTPLAITTSRAMNFMIQTASYIVNALPINLVGRGAWRWPRATKHASTFTNETKHSSSFSNDTKHSSIWSNDNLN
jgi:hypothetical protein